MLVVEQDKETLVVEEELVVLDHLFQVEQKCFFNQDHMRLQLEQVDQHPQPLQLHHVQMEVLLQQDILFQVVVEVELKMVDLVVGVDIQIQVDQDAQYLVLQHYLVNKVILVEMLHPHLMVVAVVAELEEPVVLHLEEQELPEE